MPLNQLASIGRLLNRCHRLGLLDEACGAIEVTNTMFDDLLRISHFFLTSNSPQLDNANTLELQTI